MTKENRTGANHVGLLFKELQKKLKPQTPAEQAAERQAWKAQELKVDHFDRVIR
tara:strand:+ start:175 stop:336 length:162 start_codon:yes stop_codon:yes gene_type:complete